MDEVTVIFRVHAVEQMFARNITEAEVRAVLEDGGAIESRPEDPPVQLLLGWVEGRPLHVVAAWPSPATVVVITAYEPTEELWEPGFRRRKAGGQR